MNLNRIWIGAVSALLLCGACNDGDKKVDPKPVEDAVSVNPREATVGSKGGEVTALVSSSGLWTLQGDGGEFVSPSVLRGRDGDEVTFTVKPNDREEDRLFTYTFTCGTRSVPFAITLRKMAPKADPVLEIFYPEEANMLPREGGKVTVLVTSSDKWSLEGESDFVKPSLREGEDGAEVEFVVAPNETDQEKQADFTFHMGEKQVPFRITVKGGIPERIEIVSKPELRLSYQRDERVAVKLKTNVDPRDLKAEISGADDGWLTWTIARPTEGEGEGEGMVTAYFAVQRYVDAGVREATVRIRGVKNGEATLKVTQLPLPQLEIRKTEFYLGVDAQTLEVPVQRSNYEFEVAVAEAGQGWLSFKEFTGGKLLFAVEALGSAPARQCEVTLTEKNAPDNAEPQKMILRVTQKPKGLIECVADMRQSRCYFSTLKTPQALKDMKAAGTMEALVNIKEARTAGTLSTIFGIEGKFLLRMGDVGVPWNQLQLATYGGNKTDKALTLSETDRWYHIALTWDGINCTFYIDGKPVYKTFLSLYRGLDLGITYGGYENDGNRAFWIGYSYDANRTFPGYMAEVRIWNRALSAEEINAENHFYTVPVDSKGLVGYWKLNDASGQIVKDYSPSGNDMLGEINVRSQRGVQRGTPGMHWVEINLP